MAKLGMWGYTGVHVHVSIGKMVLGVELPCTTEKIWNINVCCEGG